jgi:hypothetical protein
MLFCLMSCIFYLLSGCNNEVGHSNFETTPQNIEITTTPTPTQSITPTKLLTSTVTPEPTVDYVNLIQNIDQNVLVDRKVKRDGQNHIEFSSLDFSSFDKVGKDIRKVYFELPLPVGNSFDIWNVHFYNDNRSFIYASYDFYRYHSSIYKYDIETELSEQITFQDVYLSDISDNEMLISYKTNNSDAYIIDMSGYGYQYAPNIDVYSEILFSPDDNFVALIGRSNKLPDSYLFVGTLYESNSFIQISTDPVKEWNSNIRFQRFLFSWAPDSRSIVYQKNQSDATFILCQTYIESHEELCYPEYPFFYIDDIDLSADNLLIFSGLNEPVDNPKCETCPLGGRDSNLYLLNFDSGELFTISDNPHTETHPIWIQDDQFILYQHYENHVVQIYITDKTGSFHIPLTNFGRDTYLLN